MVDKLKELKEDFKSTSKFDLEHCKDKVKARLLKKRNIILNQIRKCLDFDSPQRAAHGEFEKNMSKLLSVNRKIRGDIDFLYLPDSHSSVSNFEFSVNGQVLKPPKGKPKKGIQIEEELNEDEKTFNKVFDEKFFENLNANSLKEERKKMIKEWHKDD
jgi:hypothetical protein